MILFDAEKRKLFEALKAEKAAPRKAARREHKAATKAARAEHPFPGDRHPRDEDAQYLAWMRGLPCVICVKEGAAKSTPRCEAAHVRFADASAGWSHTGKSEKPDDRRTAPLCHLHHREGPKAQHGRGERLWWEAHGIFPPDLCAALSFAYDNNEDGAAVVHRFANDSSKLCLGGTERSECEANTNTTNTKATS